MTPDVMTPELRTRLLDRLAVRSDRLSKMAAINAPTSVLALMAAHVTTTAILLLGEQFAQTVIEKMVMHLREGNGICLCGNGLLAPGQNLCQPCIDQVEKEDQEIAREMAIFRPTKGQPS